MSAEAVTTCPECGAEVVYFRGDFSVGYRCFHVKGCSHADAWYVDISNFRSNANFAWLRERLGK